MAYKELLDSLAGTTEERVAQVYFLLESGDITADEAQAVIASIIGKANLKAASLATASLAATLSLQMGLPVPVTLAPGLPAGKVEALKLAVSTIVGTPDDKADAVMRIRRLGRLEPIDAAANAYSEGISRSPVVKGWSRGLSASPCALCRDWAQGGKVWPSSHKMIHHKGCTCTQQPITKERATNASAPRRNRNSRSAAARSSLNTA